MCQLPTPLPPFLYHYLIGFLDRFFFLCIQMFFKVLWGVQFFGKEDAILFSYFSKASQSLVHLLFSCLNLDKQLHTFVSRNCLPNCLKYSTFSISHPSLKFLFHSPAFLSPPLIKYRCRLSIIYTNLLFVHCTVFELHGRIIGAILMI